MGCYQTCTQTQGDRFTEQRYLGQAYYRNVGIAVELTPGVVQVNADGAETTTFRASVPNPRLNIYMNDDVEGQFTIHVKNIAPDSQVSILSVEEIIQNSSFSSFGLLENTDNCETKATASLPDCAQTQTGECIPPEVQIAGPDTHLSITFRLTPCRHYSVRFDPPTQVNSPLSYAVIGAVESPARLNRIIETAIKDDVDFVVFLGDANGAGVDDHLADLVLATQHQVPVIVIPGRDEVDVGAALFAQAFGPFDFRWTYDGVQFLTFYSSEGTLGSRGIALLNNILKAMFNEDAVAQARDNDQVTAARRWPAFGFTNLPPLAIQGVKDTGLTSRHEAARVMSLLAQFDINTLFVSEAGEPTQRAPFVYPTQDEDDSSYLLVQIYNEAGANRTPVNNRFVSITRRNAP